MLGGVALRAAIGPAPVKPTPGADPQCALPILYQGAHSHIVLNLSRKPNLDEAQRPFPVRLFEPVESISGSTPDGASAILHERVHAPVK